MGLNDTPNSERVHIGFFGMRNAGKSSLVNAVTGQKLSVVSDVAGTTTDPVRKAMELLPIGPVLIIDTPGFDDEGRLGDMRVDAARRTLASTDIAVLVVNSEYGISDIDRELIGLFKEKNIPYIIAYNKSDKAEISTTSDNEIAVSAIYGTNIYELKELIGSKYNKGNERRLVADLIHPGEYVILVVPIDSAAPKGRLILPQQQAIRDILDSCANAIVVKENELKNTLENIGVKPSLVITDSQVFEKAAKDTPENIPLTSFSILMARYKGFLSLAADGAKKVDELKDGDTVLIAEGCTHHRQCEDIGTVKLPKWIKAYTGHDIKFEFSSGMGFPDELERYSLVIHCGGCMLNEREINHRMQKAYISGVPVTNYGTIIAYMKGILERSMKIL